MKADDVADPQQCIERFDAPHVQGDFHSARQIGIIGGDIQPECLGPQSRSCSNASETDQSDGRTANPPHAFGLRVFPWGTDIAAHLVLEFWNAPNERQQKRDCVIGHFAGAVVRCVTYGNPCRSSILEVDLIIADTCSYNDTALLSVVDQ